MNSALFAEVLIKSTVILTLGLVIRSLIKKENPSLRHVILLVAILGSLAIPFVVPMLTVRTTITLPKELSLRTSQPDGNVSVISSATTSRSAPQPATKDTFPWQEIALVVWSIGTCFVLVRYGLGLISLAVLRRRQSQPIEILYTHPQIHSGPADIRVSTSENLRTAMTWGIFRPVVLLPRDSQSWTSHRMEMILLHEFAHMRRRDFASQLLVEIVCAIYWFNPLVWQSARALREDAELAADDAVLQTGIRPSDYASELLQIAANLGNKNLMLNRVGISTMTNPKIESRLTAILSSNAKSRGITTVSVVAALVASGIGVTAISSLKLQQDQTPAQQRTLAMSRLKQVALATILYAQDYDEFFPHVSATKDVRPIVAPYIEDKNCFKSPRPGGDFLYNLNIGGIDMIRIPSPAETPMWFEEPPKDLLPIVGYTDGHVKSLTEDEVVAFRKALKQKFPRGKGQKPIIGIGMSR